MAEKEINKMFSSRAQSEDFTKEVCRPIGARYFGAAWHSRTGTILFEYLWRDIDELPGIRRVTISTSGNGRPTYVRKLAGAALMCWGTGASVHVEEDALGRRGGVTHRPLNKFSLVCPRIVWIVPFTT
jgi:hypothetical protein